MSETPLAAKFDFTNEAVAVTGGASGIGKAVCETFAGQGANVAVADIDADAAETVADAIEDEYDTRAIAIETDVSSYDAAEEMIETTVDEFGSIDVLVNNAGLSTRTSSFLESTPEDWDRSVGVTYFGTMNCTHAALPHMIDQEGGCVINYASDSYKGNDPSLAVYGGAKAANVAFTMNVAKEVGEHNIRLNVVSPGTTETPATAEWIDKYRDKILESYALERLGTPQDIADTVAFLASDAADWITAEVVSVNGGYIRG
ncbi:2-hydroxycyclohexanecarboxyl-CoA dehydrogenase [Natronorubrum sediminis]|uniref:2-hydroxycyclohexanecarboxyl-CoA dehydrogenase n=1 Tax=Natronorubrum sediminis TaxID=640943 RepID=A0A1H6G6A6_9EURY|nr:glucose 1-dehydrogenase [Natronorubrum sediminis]SEH18150.1 2-hydroxycyclohexanecarboxyl-CoA dehydrogenase [Natronorubrum sediminis]